MTGKKSTGFTDDERIAPALSPKTWYGMPACAKDGKCPGGTAAANRRKRLFYIGHYGPRCHGTVIILSDTTYHCSAVDFGTADA